MSSWTLHHVYEPDEQRIVQCHTDYPTSQGTGEKNVRWPVLSEEVATDYPTFIEKLRMLTQIIRHSSKLCKNQRFAHEEKHFFLHFLEQTQDKTKNSPTHELYLSYYTLFLHRYSFFSRDSLDVTKKCRIIRGKITFGTGKKMSDDPCCRKIRGKMSDKPW